MTTTACANGQHKYLLEVFLQNPLHDEESDVVGFNTRDEALAYLQTREDDSSWAMLWHPNSSVEEFYNVEV